MLVVSHGPRADLAALCERGLDWKTGASRVLPDPKTARQAAVLVLFGVLDTVPAQSPTAAPARVPRDLDVLLLRRASTLGSHPGQIAFPGGRLEDSDAGPIAAALREAVALPVSNHLVTPVPAWWTRPSVVAAVDHAETVDVFRVPVADLLDPANRANTEHTISGTTYRAPAFTVDGRLIWGFTAIVLSRMFDELGWAGPWDHDTVVRPDR
jgi:hypothetical protein